MMVNIDKIRFKNYCWSMGNTSFRTRNLNLKIEQQLIYLKEFFSMNQYKSRPWRECQRDYYYYLKDKDFIRGNAPNPEKDAREKTAGLVDLGLINDERRLTAVGKRLVSIAISEDFKDNNYFDIDKDSYIYLCQLLKCSTENGVRPFVILLREINKYGVLMEDEFKYLLPLAIDKETAKLISSSIAKVRSGHESIDEVLLRFIKSMENYQAGFELFMDSEPSVELFERINCNRKSPKYEKAYYPFYCNFVEVYKHGNCNRILDLFDSINLLNGGKSFWKKMLFSTSIRNKVKNNPVLYINDIGINKESSEEEIKKFFYYNTHLFKWKQTLSDYFDLNRRFFKTSDIVLFKNSTVQMTESAKYYFNECIEAFYEHSFIKSDNFYKLTSIEEILGVDKPSMEKVYDHLASVVGEAHLSPSQVNAYLINEKLKQFNSLIDESFSDEKLIYYLNCFENRDDDILLSEITENADVPTLFEYILAICWYKLSKKKGNILDYMNLSLDVDLLPKQHAGGGEADIVYKYEKTAAYPEHTVLVEATLADSTMQRRMEMEPVSRHLMRQLEESKNLNDYAVLVTTYVHPSVVSDFRSRANNEQTLDYVHFYNGIKILPVSTEVIKKLIMNQETYDYMYKFFEEAYKSPLKISEGWYEKTIESI